MGERDARRGGPASRLASTDRCGSSVKKAPGLEHRRGGHVGHVGHPLGRHAGPAQRFGGVGGVASGGPGRHHGVQVVGVQPAGGERGEALVAGQLGPVHGAGQGGELGVVGHGDGHPLVQKGTAVHVVGRVPLVAVALHGRRVALHALVQHGHGKAEMDASSIEHSTCSPRPVSRAR